MTPAGDVYHGELRSLRQEVEDALSFVSKVVMPADVTSAEYAVQFSNCVNSAVRLIHLQAIGVELEYHGQMGALVPPKEAGSPGSASSDGAGAFLPERDLTTVHAPMLASGSCASCGDRERNLNKGIPVLRQLLVPCPVCESLVCARCAYCEHAKKRISWSRSLACNQWICTRSALRCV